MAMTMDISLDYGAWAGDDGDTTESRTSRKASPTIYPAGQADQFQQHSTSQRHETQQPSALSLSDPFSDSGESVYDQDLLDAEMNNASSANTSHNLSHPPNTPRGSEGRNFLNSVRIQIYDSPLIDLTESPPQPSLNSSEQSTMPPTLRNHAQSRRPPPASPPSLHTEERSRKRRRLSERSAVAELQEQSTNNEPEIEAVDLTEVNDESDLSKAISKQQQDAVQSQMKDNQGDDTGRTPLSSYKCPICMDTPEDATSTVCGKQLPTFPPPPQSDTPHTNAELLFQATSSATNASSTPSASANNYNAATTPETAEPKAPVPSAVSP